MEWRPLSLDQMLPPEHPPRLAWTDVESLDLSELYQQIRAVEGHVGRNPIDPRILIAVWLYATLDDIETLEASGTKVYAPIKDEDKKRTEGEDPFARRPSEP